MKFSLSIAVLISLALLVFGCTPVAEEPVTEAPTQAEDIAAINAIPREYEAAYNAGDAAGAAAIFADDGVSMPPNEPAVVGKEAIQSRYQSIFDEFTVQVTMSQEEVEAVGDWAFGRATYAVMQTPKAGGDTVEDNGKNLSIFKRQPDGSWKVHRSIFNSNNPVPGTAE